jgi:phage recombination protein Bet
MSNVAVLPRSKSVIADMADKFGMEPVRFEQTLRATVFPKEGTPEQFASFLLVAKQYDLNPFTREIYAFLDRRKGGIVPIVSVDGWLKLINSHPQYDGMKLEDVHDEKTGQLVAVICTMHRKDRAHPTVMPEYLAECYRDTDAWKTMAHRMLRHKATIQAARYAFGFAGIFEQDEAERIEVAPIPPAGLPARMSSPPTPPDPSAGPAPTAEGPILSPQPTPKAAGSDARKSDVANFKAALAQARTVDDAEEAWRDFIEPVFDEMGDDEQEEVSAMLREASVALARAVAEE